VIAVLNVPRRIRRRGGSEVVLIVRREQVTAFHLDIERRFAERMKGLIARAYPEHHEALGDDGTADLVRKGIEAGKRYRLDEYEAVAGLILLMVELGERLERWSERAWAEEMLSEPELPGPIKVSAVRARLRESTGGRRLAPPPRDETPRAGE